jgi:thiol-disulfide isomerase/thioredoxin
VKGLLRALIVLGILSASVLLALAYWPRSVDSREAVGSGGSEDEAPRSATLGQFTPLDPPRPAPEASFADRDGTPRRLVDFRGRWVLVNLWATWCAPCVREMPSLDRLQAKLGSRLTVLAISEDRGGASVVDPFLDKLGLAALAIYLDPKGGVGQALGAQGLPTSLLIDDQGRLRGSLEGAAEWDSPKMVATLERYLRQSAGGGIIKTSGER